MMTPEDRFREALERKWWTIVLACLQFGDTGKAKWADLLALLADIIVRAVGGANAGNTVKVGTMTRVLHLLPCGIFHREKTNVIGSGVALEPRTLLEELAALSQAGLPLGKLLVSSNAKLVLPHHILLDRAEEAVKTDKIGTTGRGIGPCYQDVVARRGLVVNDLRNPSVFRRKLEANLAYHRRVLSTYDRGLLQEIMMKPILEEGIFFNPQHIIDSDVICDRYLSHGRELQELVTDTEAFLRSVVGSLRTLVVGSHGDLLSVKKGTYPFVTSSDCSLRGIVEGADLREEDVDAVIGIAKVFYMTRVGGGPFPTEFGGKRSAAHCRQATSESEMAEYPDVSVNDPDEFRRGIAIRAKGREFGATTGRGRRTGRFDLPLLRYSVGFTGKDVALTKLDVLDEAEVIEICTEYVYTGPDYWYGDRLFRAGDVLRVAVPDPEILDHCEPRYVTLPGWQTSIRGIREFEELPIQLQSAIHFVEKEAGVNVVLLSVGPDREDTIFVKPLVL